MKTISFEVDDETYERLWGLKNDLHPESGKAVTHPEFLGLLLDRFEGQRRERPQALSGPKVRVNTPAGKVYVGINVDEHDDPFEVFITKGSSGGYTNAWAEALAKTISNALRAGVDPETIASDLMGIRGPEVAHDNGDPIYSIPDAVGVVLRRYLDGKLDPPQSVRADEDGTLAGPGPLTVTD